MFAGLVLCCLASFAFLSAEISLRNQDLMPMQLSGSSFLYQVLQDNFELKSKINELIASTGYKKELKRLEDTIGLLQDKVAALEQTTEHPDSGTVTHRKPTVAFLAVLKTHRKSVAAHQTVAFETVVTNLGNAYNVANGVFTATFSGLYQFSATILADNDQEIWCELLLNGNVVVSINARASDGRHDQGSHSIILQLNEGITFLGDRVYVRNKNKGSIYGSGYSSFSGVLLEEVSDE